MSSKVEEEEKLGGLAARGLAIFWSGNLSSIPSKLFAFILEFVIGYFKTSAYVRTLVNLISGHVESSNKGIVVAGKRKSR